MKKSKAIPKNTGENTSAMTTKVRSISRLRQPVVYVPVLIVLGVAGYFGVQQYMAVREKGAFRKLEKATASAVDDISNSLGSPLYSDSHETCFMRSPEEFSGKRLYCATDIAAYYKISDSKASTSVNQAKTLLEGNMGITLTRPSYASNSQLTLYRFGSQRLSLYGDISCGVEVRYPAGLSNANNLPLRDFGDESVMYIGISCDKRMVRAIYPMVDR